MSKHQTSVRDFFTKKRKSDEEESVDGQAPSSIAPKEPETKKPSTSSCLSSQKRQAVLGANSIQNSSAKHVIEVSGDLLKSDAQYIAHQCNCVSKYGKHLAYAVNSAFPYADDYRLRRDGKLGVSKPGTIRVHGGDDQKRGVINMFAQFAPGNPRGNKDSASMRERWFEQCLGEISKIEGLESIAFPHKIGCGAAGGDWTKYSAMLERFAAAQGPGTKVYIVQMA